jgi:hypothetical protein
MSVPASIPPCPVADFERSARLELTVRASPHPEALELASASGGTESCEGYRDLRWF